MNGSFRRDAARWLLLPGVLLPVVTVALGRLLPAPAALLIAVVAGCGLAFLLAGRLAAPLERLARAARLFAVGQIQRLPVRLTGDEFDAIADSMTRLGQAWRGEATAREREAHQLRRVLETMVEGVMVLGPDGRVTLENAALRTLFAGTDSFLRRTPLEIFRNPEFDAAARAALAGGGPQSLEISVGFPDTAGAGPPDAGGRRTFQVSLAPLPFEDDTGAVVVFHDVSRLRELEVVRRDFVANVSHELRTPLTAIRGYVETLGDPGLPPADRSRFMEKVTWNTARLSSLIEDLLQLSRIESPLTRLDVRPIALAPLLDRARDLMEEKASAAGVVLNLEPAGDLPPVVGDAGAVEQILINLLDNAIKYTGAGGSVSLGAGQASGRVRIEVRDTGTGIPAVHLPRLFERFYRVDAGRSRELGGTGLGLAIVKHLAQMQGGEVGVESTPGRGSNFWFTLRVAGGAEVPAAAPPVAES